MPADKEIKIVSDTNVVISAAVSSDGNPAEIFELLLLGKIKNFTSDEIINEIKEVMEREKIRSRLTLYNRRFIIDNFEKFSVKIIPKIKNDIIKEDPKDNKFLDCAVSANTGYIISGDEHLLSLKEFKGIKILSPAEFVKLFDKKTSLPP